MSLDIEEVLNIIRQELLLQTHKHSQAALAKLERYKKNQNVALINQIFRLTCTAEALANFGRALTLENLVKWAGKPTNENCEDG